MPETQPIPNTHVSAYSQPTTAWLFGTFNPIHVGHMAMAHAALQSGRCTQVMLVPSAVPPWKNTDPQLLPFTDRCQLIRLALNNEPNIQLCTAEADWACAHPGKPSTTWEILQYLHQLKQLTWPVTLIMGQDSVQSLGQWAEAETLIDHAHILQVPRVEDTSGALLPFQQTVTLPSGQAYPITTSLLSMAPVTVSSRHLRQAIQSDPSSSSISPSMQWRHQVHPDVATAITKNHYWLNHKF